MTSVPVDAAPPGWRTLLGRAHGAVVITLAGGVGLHATNVYLATTVMPSVVADIGGARLYAWATTVFVVASVLGSATAGALLARSGPRWAYRWSALVLVAGTVICALSPTMIVLLIGRAAQGFGGGLLFALCYSIVRVALDESLWPRAMALVSAMWGVATLIGPALGGVWAQLDMWRGAFWMLIPVLLLFLVWGAGRLPPASERQGSVQIPWVAVGLLTASALVISVASVSDSLLVNAVGLVGAAALLVLWLRYERTATVRVLPAAAFGPDRRLRLVYITMSVLVIASSVEVFVPYFGQHLQGLSPLEAGYFGAAMAAGWTAGSLLFSGVSARRGLLIGLAPVSCVLGLAILIAAGPTTTHSPAILLIIVTGLVLLGGGIGAVFPHLLTDVFQLAGDRDQDLAGSSATIVQLTATAFGSALAGTVANLAGFTDPAATAHAARWLFAVFLIPAVLAWLASRLIRRDDKALASG
ncbi:MAG: transporter [Nocardia sp.]|uniref:MFS transporter n=1 Tax=Nocardia sp. TaxID=1821 RepID=UPI00261792A6|nr:MFS transporter [Nocardia sp.]MCU1639909.1 transporter [Nocardia sp.]